MSSVYLVFIITVGIAQLVGSWRLALLALVSETGCVAALQWQSHGSVWMLADTVGLRCMAGPVLFALVLERTHPSRRLDTVAANLLHWLGLGGCIGLAIALGLQIEAVDPSDNSLLVTAVASAVLVGMFVISTQSNAAAQVIGVLTIENGILLFESALGHHPPVALQLGTTVIYALTVLASLFFVYEAPRSTEPDAVLQ